MATFNNYVTLKVGGALRTFCDKKMSRVILDLSRTRDFKGREDGVSKIVGGV